MVVGKCWWVWLCTCGEEGCSFVFYSAEFVLAFWFMTIGLCIPVTRIETSVCVLLEAWVGSPSSAEHMCSIAWRWWWWWWWWCHFPIVMQSICGWRWPWTRRLTTSVSSDLCVVCGYAVHWIWWWFWGLSDFHICITVLVIIISLYKNNDEIMVW